MKSPAIAADLGRLAAPLPPAWNDNVRLRLVDAVVLAKAQGSLDHAAWSAAFTAAMEALRDETVNTARQRLEAAAAHSRFPSRRLQAVLPDQAAGVALLNRLMAEGIPLERLEAFPDDAVNRRARAAALEAAWEGASGIATREAARWRGVASQVEEWQRPLRPLWILGAALLITAVLIAGMLGGVIPAPEWFRPVNDAWWSLPWP